jgi:hypothetical protein
LDGHHRHSGAGVSIAGFAISLWQLSRTRRAAEAALAASIETARSIRFVNALTDIEQICGRSRDLLHLTRGYNVSAAATAASELRSLVAKFQAVRAARLAADDAMWARLQEKIRSVHDELESTALDGQLTTDRRGELLRIVSEINTELNSLAAIINDYGANHADSNLLQGYYRGDSNRH